LPGSPFQYMLDKYGELDASVRPEALPRTLTAVAAEPNQPVDELAFDAAVNLPNRFVRELAGSAGAGTVVVVLDTVENVLHTPGADLGPVLDAFGEVAGAVRGLRVVVSGRFDLTGHRAEPGAGARPRVPGFRERWIGPVVQQLRFVDAQALAGRAVVWMELPGFSPAEARRFLAARWELTDPDVVNAIVSRAGANPMKLDLLAEYVTRTPGVDTAAIASIEDPDLIYLIHRVVDRIADGRVQWLLRWGALLPVLTRASVEQVLWPALAAFAQSRSNYDDATKDRLPESPHEVSRWEVPPAVLVARPGSLAEAWDGLLEYAASSSWVSVVAELPDAVIFHPDVREPVRGLLRRGGHPAYDDIHARAFRPLALGRGHRGGSRPHYRAARPPLPCLPAMGQA
ncbi:MAG: hypothetical protein L0K86_27540, partial [Actinomycetia bacterium]|nr:hypothetical protein [Actinomycetes bacterium]